MIEQNGLHYGYTSSEELKGRVDIAPGQIIAGYTVGILVQDVHYPLIPGNVVNASTYRYPVRMEIVNGANQKRIHSHDPSLLPELISACRRLETQGVRAIVGACGYFGHYQKEIAGEVNIPVYLSSIMQIPWILSGFGKDAGLGIICADMEHFTDHLLEQCGIGEEYRDRCRIIGAGDQPEFSALLERRGFFDNGIMEREIVALAAGLKEDHPEIKALLLECSDMPPYSAAVQKAVGLPVYDYVTMIDFVHSSVAHRPFYGFM